MSEQNLDVARRATEAFNRREVEELVALSHPDSEWLPFRAQVEGGVYRGRDGVRRFVVDMEEDWSKFDIEIQELIELDARVLLFGRVHAVARGSGVALENDAGFVMDFRNAQIVRLVSYSDPDEARREAGA
jgi:ketosteroid isomerase-like protein